MQAELFWLTLTALMTALFWVPYVLDRIIVRGLAPTLMDPEPIDSATQSKWARRAMAAHRNAIENLAVFAALVLTAAMLKISTPLTQLAAEAYFVARLLHFVVYVAGIPVLRTLLFTAGWLAQMVLAMAILHWI